MNSIFSSSSETSESGGLAQLEQLHALTELTGVPATEWLGIPGEGDQVTADRLEFLADVLLGLDEHDEAAARRAASLYRLVLGEPEAGTTAPVFSDPAPVTAAPSRAGEFTRTHGSPDAWSAVDCEVYDNLAHIDAVAQPTAVVVSLPVIEQLPAIAAAAGMVAA